MFFFGGGGGGRRENMHFRSIFSHQTSNPSTISDEWDVGYRISKFTNINQQ